MNSVLVVVGLVHAAHSIIGNHLSGGDTKIIGGEKTHFYYEYNYTYAVAISKQELLDQRSFAPISGNGALLTMFYVLTSCQVAAPNPKKPPKPASYYNHTLYLHAGTTQLNQSSFREKITHPSQRRRSREIYFHPLCSKPPYRGGWLYDYSIIRVLIPFKPNYSTHPVIPPRQLDGAWDEMLKFPLRGVKCDLVGWGSMKYVNRTEDLFTLNDPPNSLRRVKLKVIDYEMCNRLLCGISAEYEEYCTNDTERLRKQFKICAHSEDELKDAGACNGDLGSTFNCEGRVYAFTSHHPDCGAKGTPTILTAITPVWTWMRSIVKSLPDAKGNTDPPETTTNPADSTSPAPTTPAAATAPHPHTLFTSLFLTTIQCNRYL